MNALGPTLLTESNRVVLANAPEGYRAKVPSEAEVLAMFRERAPAAWSRTRTR